MIFYDKDVDLYLAFVFTNLTFESNLLKSRQSSKCLHYQLNKMIIILVC